MVSVPLPKVVPSHLKPAAATKQGELAVVVASGGMDSATLAYHYRDRGFDLLLLGMNYGQRHVRELGALEQLGQRLNAPVKIADLSSLHPLLHGSALTSDDVAVPDGHYAEDSMAATVVPNRNAILLSVAAGVGVAEQAYVVAVGIHAGDHFIYPDCRPAFFKPFAKAIEVGTKGHAKNGFRLEAPFIRLTKADIAKLGHTLGVPFELTWSCYKGNEMHCGACGTCYERREAFIEAQIPDPTEYAATPMYKAPGE